MKKNISWLLLILLPFTGCFKKAYLSAQAEKDTNQEHNSQTIRDNLNTIKNSYCLERQIDSLKDLNNQLIVSNHILDSSNHSITNKPK